MSVKERVRDPVRPVLGRVPPATRTLWKELAGLLAVCVAGGLVAGFFLGLYRAGHYSVPVGYDSIYRYLPDTALVSAKGLVGASDVVLPPPFRAFTSRVGFPVLVLSLSRLLGVSTFKFAAVVPVAAIAALALAAGALVTSSLRRGALELSAVALIVGLSSQMVRLLVPEAYADNIFSGALFVAALVALMPYVQGRRGFLAASLLLAASGLAHPSFFSFEMVILAVVGLLYLPTSWRSWRRGSLPLLSTPVARLVAVAATGAVVLALALFAVLGTGPQVPWFARQIFWQKLRADLHLYRFLITVPLALAGAAVLAAHLRSSRPAEGVSVDGRGPRDPGGASEGARSLLLLAIGWVAATMIAILAFALGRPVPVHRLLAFLLPLPLLGALAVLTLGRLAGTKGGRVASLGVALAGIALFAYIGYDNLYRDIPRKRGVQPVGVERIKSAATAAAFLDKAHVPDWKPVVFLITDRGRDPRSGIPLAAYAIRSVLPVETAERAYFYVGEPRDYLQSRPARYPGDADRLNRVSAALWPAVKRILPQRPVALLLAGYNPDFSKIAERHPEWRVAPGVLVVRGPRPPVRIGRPPIPSAPRGGVQLATFGAGTLVLLALTGLGWAVALLPSGLRAFELLALAGAFGIGFLILGGTLMDTLGLRLGGPVGPAVAPIVGVMGWFFAGWRLRRDRDRRRELRGKDGSATGGSSPALLVISGSSNPAADGPASPSGSAAADRGKPRGWARAQLAREIYWAADPVIPRPEVKSTAKLTEITREFERSLRADARAAVPTWEPTLRVGRRWRRLTKRTMFRLLRPITRRYDRVAADLAMLEGSLAQQVERSDAEVRRLERSLAEQKERSETEIRRLTALLEALEAQIEPSASTSGGAEVTTSAEEASVPQEDAGPDAAVRDTADGGEEAEPSDATDPADRFYWLFEEKMRGSPDSITSRLRAYEGRVAELRTRADEGEVPLWVDLGCGQGEFGVLLQEWGWSYRGVDASARAVQACRARGLDVAQGNLLEYLKSYSGDRPLGMSAIQVIEHLPKDLWLTFFLEAKRILRPGGALLVETINILAPGPLAHSFFPDPTHTWPPHPETVRLMATFAGFAEAHVMFLNDDPGGNAQDFALWAVTPP